MRNPVPALSLLVSLVFLIQPSIADARIWHVPAEAPTIQAGIDSAASGDTVEVTCGIYYEHDINMKSGIVLRSETEDPACVTIDAKQLGRVILCQDLDQSTAITGMTITGGLVPGSEGSGGGIHCTNSVLNLTHCDLVGNYSGYRGGGLTFESCDPVITNCRFIANESYMSGGGIYCFDSEAEITNCHIEANVSTDGAGLFCARASPRLSWCTFLNNDGLFFGGAIYCHVEASPDLTNCSLVGNGAYLGGGIMTVAQSYPDIENCIIAFSPQGEGIHCYDDLGDSTLVNIICSNVFGNAGGSYTGWIDDQTGLNGNIAVDPLFCDLEAGDIQLAGESQCLPDGNECGVLMGSQGEGCTISLAPDNQPVTFNLAQNCPNPFNPSTEIMFELPRATHARLSIYDATGRRIVTLVDGFLQPGVNRVAWNGRDESGRAVSSGVFICRLETSEGQLSRKLTLLK
jgi:hypothetical protein